MSRMNVRTLLDTLDQARLKLAKMPPGGVLEPKSSAEALQMAIFEVAHLVDVVKPEQGSAQR